MAQLESQKNYYSAYNLGTKPGDGVPDVDKRIKVPIFKYSVRVVKEGGEDDGYEYSSSTKIGIDYEKDRDICENIYFQLVKKIPAFQFPGAYFYNGQGTLYSTVKIPLEETVIFGLIISPEQRQMFRIKPDHTVFEIDRSKLEWTRNIPILANGTPLRNMYQNDYGLYYPRRNEVRLLDKSSTEHYVLDTQQILFVTKEDLNDFRTKRFESAARYQNAIQKSVYPKFHSNGEVRFGMEEDSIVNEMKRLADFHSTTDQNNGFVKTIEEKYSGVELILSARAAHVLNIAENQKKVLFIRTGPSANNIGFFQNESFQTVAQHYHSMLNYPDLFTAFVTDYDDQVMLVPVEFLLNPPQVTARSCVPIDEVSASTNKVPLEDKQNDSKHVVEIPNKELDSLDISQKNTPFSSSLHVSRPSISINPMGRGGFVNNRAPMVRGFPGVSRPSTSAENFFADPQSVRKWIIYYQVQFDQKSSQKIEFILNSSMRSHGMDVNEAEIKTVLFDKLKLDDIRKIFVEAKQRGTQLILFMLPKKFKVPEDFGSFIKFCTVHYNIPSQSMKSETIDMFGKLGPSFSYDFAGKTNLKLGGLNKTGSWKDDILLVGINFPTDRVNNADVVGYAHNMVENPHKFAGKFILNKNCAKADREIIQSILEGLTRTLKPRYREVFIWLQGCIDVIPDIKELRKHGVLGEEQFHISIISLIETFPENEKRKRYTTNEVFFVEETRQEKTEISQFKMIDSTLNSDDCMDKMKKVTRMACDDKQLRKKNKTIPTPTYVASKQLQLGRCVRKFISEDATY